MVRLAVPHFLTVTILLIALVTPGELRAIAQVPIDSARLGATSSGPLRVFESRIMHFGSELIPSPRSTISLRLKPNTHAEVDLHTQLSASEGTISFWVHPLWEKDDHASHTFLSLAWNEPKKSYLAITLGWWEPHGSNRLYFIVSNQEYAHCSAPYQLGRESWSMVTAVWKAGSKGYCKLFVNGRKVAEEKNDFKGKYLSRGPLFLGSDKGTTQARGRSADALLEDLLLYGHPFTEEESKAAYEAQEKDLEGATVRKWKWLDSGLIFPNQTAQTRMGEVLESRVIFDEDMHWAVSKNNADKILSRVKEAGFNVFVPCVWHGNGTYYPTVLTDPDPKLANVISEYDPLTYLIEKAHSLGIEVHPWFTVMRRENSRYPDFFGEGVPDGSYDVHNQEFRKFIIDLMVDVVRRYNVEGVNLDYIRAMGLCTSDSCRADYNRETGRNFWTDYSLRAILGPARNRLEQWQDQAVRDIVDTFSRRAKEINPDLIISVDGHPKPKTEHRPLEGRNEIDWINDGLIDVVFAMDYRETIDYETINAVRKDLRRPERLIVLFGNYDRLSKTSPAVPRRGNLVAKYASYAQHQWPSSGVGFYIYGQMTDEQVAALRAGPFKYDAKPAWGRSQR